MTTAIAAAWLGHIAPALVPQRALPALCDGQLVLPGAHDEAATPLEPLHQPLAD